MALNKLRPVWVYDIWAAYTDGFYQEYLSLPDETRLTEQLAMTQLRELARLQRAGVHFDYYMMNAFWFDPNGGYRGWRQPDWPDGPDRWIAGCYEQGLKPGLWFGTNSLWKISPASAWQDSLAPVKEKSRGAFVLDDMSLFEGGFLADFMEVLQHWYDRGIRLFEFDTANFDAATSGAMNDQSLHEIRERNRAAFHDALKAFRCENPDALLVAFNGFGGDMHGTATPFPFKNPVDLRWLEVFDSLYTGDTRVSDVPLMNFWRSVDLFSDHMVRRYEQSGVPLECCDPFFTLSPTWFGHQRGKQAWKSMLLLTAARGSWKTTIYGDLRLLGGNDARLFAQVQRMYEPLSETGRVKTFGGIPGEVQPYGYCSFDMGGALYTAVNPTQTVQALELPQLARSQDPLQHGRVLFRDAGFDVRTDGATLILGPEQMAVVGFGRYAEAQFDLGMDNDIPIPLTIAQVEASWREQGTNIIETTLAAPTKGDLRVLFQQRAEENEAPRSTTLTIEALQNGKVLAVLQPNQDKAVSTGISWAAGEIKSSSFHAGEPLTICCRSPEKHPVRMEASVYVVEYGKEQPR